MNSEFAFRNHNTQNCKSRLGGSFLYEESGTYWLLDDALRRILPRTRISEAVIGDAHSVFAAPDVILRRMDAGKPEITCREDGTVRK